MKRQCNGDPACIAAVNEWYREMLQDVLDGYRDAIRENWKDAYERRKAWEDKLREMIPTWPDLKTLLPKKGVIGSINLTTTSLGSGSPSEAALWDTTIKLSGTSVFTNTLSATAEITGTISMSGFTAADGSRSADIYSGSIVATINGGDDMMTMTLETDPRNHLVLGANNTGTLTMIVTREISDKRWNALVPYYIQVQLPVTRLPDDTLTISMNGVKLTAITGHRPFTITDYNGDGIRDYSSDYAIFLADHGVGAPRADMNEDGIFDQDDLDMWTNLFLIDKDAE